MNIASLKNNNIVNSLQVNESTEMLKNNRINTFFKNTIKFEKNLPLIDEGKFEKTNGFYISKSGWPVEDTEENRLLQSLTDIKDEFTQSMTYTDKTPDTNVLSKFASEFSKLKTHIETNFDGEEKEKMLITLNNRYDSEIKDVAKFMEIQISMVASINRLRETHAQNVQKNGKTLLGVEEINDTTIEAHRKAFRELGKALYKSITTMGNNAKTFILSGNKVPSSEGEISIFKNYISEGAPINFNDFSGITDFTKAMSNSINDSRKFQDSISAIINGNLPNETKELLGEASGLKLNFAEKPFVKEINQLELQLQNAIREQKSINTNNTKEKNKNYIDTISQSLYLLQSGQNIEAEIMKAYGVSAV